MEWVSSVDGLELFASDVVFQLDPDVDVSINMSRQAWGARGISWLRACLLTLIAGLAVSVSASTYLVLLLTALGSSIGAAWSLVALHDRTPGRATAGSAVHLSQAVRTLMWVVLIVIWIDLAARAPALFVEEILRR